MSCGCIPGVSQPIVAMLVNGIGFCGDERRTRSDNECPRQRESGKTFIEVAVEDFPSGSAAHEAGSLAALKSKTE